MSSSPPPAELCSWKDIASHLGVSVKTAQVWERDRGLPVHRLPGPRGQVRVVLAELEMWKLSRPSYVVTAEETPTPPVPASFSARRSVVYSVAVLMTALILILSLVSAQHTEFASVRIDFDALVGLNRSGSVLWRHGFDSLMADAYTAGDRRPWVGDLDDDGSPEVLFMPVPTGVVQRDVPLVCFDARGAERWRFIPGRTIRQQGEVLRPPFVGRAFTVLGKNIVVTSHHHLYSPCQVAVLDRSGRLLREYWHPGHLNVITTGTHGGRPVAILGGINNRRHSATVVVLDPAQLRGAAIEGGAPFIAEMGNPIEVVRLFFPRSGLHPSAPYNGVVQLFNQNDRLLVDVHERLIGNDRPSIQYHLDDNYELKQVVVSDAFLNEYATINKRAFTTIDGERLQRLTRVEHASR